MLKKAFLAAALCAASISGAQAPASHEGPAQPHRQSPGSAKGVMPLETGDLEAFLDGLIPTQLAANSIPGAVVVVVRGSEVLLAKGYGYQDAADRIPVSPERTLFRVGSISKTVTALAVMQLVEKGRLDLDAEVGAHLDVPLKLEKGPITLRQLLTHTAGFEDTLKNLILVRPGDMPGSLRARLQSFQPRQVFKPGTTPSYSNYGLSVAGHLVEIASGERFDRYVEGHLFRPLGMHRSSFGQPLPPHLARDAAVARGAGGAALPYELIPDVPAGAMAATGADMAKYMSSLLAIAGGERTGVVEADTMASMLSRQRVNHPALNALGLTFFEESSRPHRIFGHSGATASFATQMSLILDADVGFYVAYSGHGRGYPPAALATERFLERYFPSKPAGALARYRADPAAEERLLGLYTSTRLNHTGRLKPLLPIMGQVEVRRNPDGTLSMDVERKSDGSLRRFRAIGPGLYEEVGGTNRLAFVDDRSGRTTMYTDVAAMAFQKTRPLEGRWLNLALLGFALPVLTCATISGALALAGRRRQPADPSPRGLSRFPVRSAAALNLLLLVLCGWLLSRLSDLAGLALFSSRNDLIAVAIGVAGILAVFLSIVGATAVGLRWRRSETRIVERVGATLTALACLISAWLLSFWNVASISVSY
ncbi:serine hydrolase domain-containing protein [Sphingomonas sp.]|jgi:CubicO group peptidase (beta-lactamase class C family)|uniref:serine hydrolase domain-containing protein n=1 Tax=Sphingomonas sp. TaxID=28214 RepID=UPI002DE993DE|nr:serine hydrolase domain-containing protein [Sphingomonas sp.]